MALVELWPIGGLVRFLIGGLRCDSSVLRVVRGVVVHLGSPSRALWGRPSGVCFDPCRPPRSMWGGRCAGNRSNDACWRCTECALGTTFCLHSSTVHERAADRHRGSAATWSAARIRCQGQRAAPRYRLARASFANSQPAAACVGILGGPRLGREHVGRGRRSRLGCGVASSPAKRRARGTAAAHLSVEAAAAIVSLGRVFGELALRVASEDRRRGGGGKTELKVRWSERFGTWEDLASQHWNWTSIDRHQRCFPRRTRFGGSDRVRRTRSGPHNSAPSQQTHAPWTATLRIVLGPNSGQSWAAFPPDFGPCVWFGPLENPLMGEGGNVGSATPRLCVSLQGGVRLALGRHGQVSRSMLRLRQARSRAVAEFAHPRPLGSESVGQRATQHRWEAAVRRGMPREHLRLETAAHRTPTPRAGGAEGRRIGRRLSTHSAQAPLGALDGGGTSSATLAPR